MGQAGRARRAAALPGAVVRWSIGALVVAGALACSNASTPTGQQSMTTYPTYLIVKNTGSVDATVVVDLNPVVSTNVEINICHVLSFPAPISDSVTVAVSDSGATTSSTYHVPFYLAGVWAVNAAANYGAPIPLGNIGEVPTTC